MLDYTILGKASFTVVGVKRQFNSETSYEEIPEGMWAQFPCTMETLQDTNTKI